MPGFNRRGPMNEGAMTGKRHGLCAGGPVESENRCKRDEYTGFGRQRRNRACQALGRRMGFNPFEAEESGHASSSITKEDLQNRSDNLEAELAVIKKEIKALSRSED